MNLTKIENFFEFKLKRLFNAENSKTIHKKYYNRYIRTLSCKNKKHGIRDVIGICQQKGKKNVYHENTEKIVYL